MDVERQAEIQAVFDRHVVSTRQAWELLFGTCGSQDPVTRRWCDKPVGHWRFRDGRRLHRSNERHTGRMAETYPATWVHVWREPTTTKASGQS